MVASGCGEDAARSTEPPNPDDLRPVVIFAAASLGDAVGELEPALREAGLAPRFNVAGSNVLARQIEATPAADLFLSANPGWMEHLERAGRLVPGSRRPILANRLVAVARTGSPLTATVTGPRDLATADYRYLSLGDPRGVPAGIYARRFLEAVEMPAADGGGTLWEAVADRLAPAADVRGALAQVAARRDVVGLVYATDARSSQRVEVLFEVPTELAPEIVYEAAAVAGGPAGEAAARRALEVLDGAAARRTFRRHGFTLPGAGSAPAGPDPGAGPGSRPDPHGAAGDATSSAPGIGGEPATSGQPAASGGPGTFGGPAASRRPTASGGPGPP